jgi:alpha-pyrone synthase
MSFITAISTANPALRLEQAVIAEFMLRKMHFSNGEARKLKTIFKASGIRYRHTVLEDYGKISDYNFYPERNDEMHPSTQARLDIFKRHALPLSIRSAASIFQTRPELKPKQITHLIVVCCTGMYAPGLDIDLVKALGLKSDVQRTAINFMGCYAAFNALKIADAFCKSCEEAKVLIVCTELCSLHFQPDATEDNLLANALFGDGSAAVLVENKTVGGLKLEIKEFHNDLAIKGEHDMAWSIGDLGFQMRLSAYVPGIIKEGIGSITRALLNKISKKFADIKFFAIHPGGKKILEMIEQELGITKEQNRPAYAVLENYGNMSSPTVLFVLHDLISRLTHEDIGEHVLSFAFGPGLTMESMVLEIKQLNNA